MGMKKAASPRHGAISGDKRFYSSIAKAAKMWRSEALGGCWVLKFKNTGSKHMHMPGIFNVRGVAISISYKLYSFLQHHGN